MAGCWWPWPRRCRKGGDAGDGRKGGDAGDGRKGGDACQCCQGCQPCQSCQSQSSPDATGESLTAWHCEPMQPRWDTFKSRFNLQLQGNVELVHLVKDPFLGKWWKILAEGLLLSMVPLMNLPIIYKVIWSRQSPEVLTDKEVCDGNLDDFCSFQLLQTSSPQSCVIVEIWNSTWCRMNILLSFVVIVIHFIHIISIQYIQYIHIECLQTWHSTRSRLLAIESSSTGFDTFRIVPEATTMLGRGYPFPKAADFHRFRRKKTHTESSPPDAVDDQLRHAWEPTGIFAPRPFLFVLYLDSDSINSINATIYECGQSPGASRLAVLRCRIRLASHCDSPGYALTFLTKDNLLQDWGGVNWDAARNREPGWKHDEHVWKLFTFIQAFIEFHPFSRLFFI